MSILQYLLNILILTFFFFFFSVKKGNGTTINVIFIDSVRCSGKLETPTLNELATLLL